MNFSLRSVLCFASRLTLCALAILALAAIPAQSAEKVRLYSLDRVTTQNAGALVSVENAEGEPRRDLKAQDFTVRAKNGALKIREVRPVSTEKLGRAVVLCLDLSGSMAPHLSELRSAARSFVNQLGPRDSVGIVTFDAAPRVALHLTDDLEVARSVIGRLKIGRGDTAALDALDAGRALIGEAKTPLRALALFSDGGDNRSALNASDIARLARRDLPMVLVPAPTLAPQNRRAKLVELATQTGGATGEKATQRWRELALDGYHLKFAAPAPGSGMQNVEISAKGATPARFKLTAAPLPPSPNPNLMAPLMRLAGVTLLVIAALALGFVLLTRDRSKKTENAGQPAFLVAQNDARIAVPQNGGIIGRGSEAAIRLSGDSEISRRHAQLRPTGNGWEIADLESANGVVVNGQPVSRAALRSGDVVQIGETVFHWEAVEK